jgi:hypothetical protein
MFDTIGSLSAAIISAAPRPGTITLTILSILAAALLRGFTGFGFALAAVPLLGFIMPPTQAVPVAVGLQFLAGVMDFPLARKEGHWPSLRWLILGAMIGSPLGALALIIVPAAIARIIIAAITLGAITALRSAVHVQVMPSRAITILVGLTCGIFNGLAAMPGPPVVMYYAVGQFGRVATHASLLVFFLATSVVALISTATLGLFDLRACILTLVALPIMIAGSWLGRLAFHRGSEALHRRVSIASLGVVAIGSAMKGISELTGLGSG